MHIHNDWASALIAINELLRTHAGLFNHDSVWKRVREATNAEDDHQRHLAVEVILKECLATVSEHTQNERAKREGYEMHRQHFADRFAGLTPYGNLNDRLYGVRYVSFYNISRECYSPAEGGCWFDRHTLVATFPLSHFSDFGERDYDVVLAVASGEAARMELNYDCIRLECFPAEFQTLKTPTYE